MVIATSVGNKMWFGTRENMQWIDTPLSGADVSPQTWTAGGTLLNGGGWQKSAEGSHKTYNYSWRNSSTRQTAQLMQSYRDGDYGTGLIYFVDPLTYNTNILPKGWASPHLTTNGGYPSLVPGTTPVRVATSTGVVNDNHGNNYPRGWARYNLPVGSATQRRVFVPVPEGFSLHLGAVYNGTPNVVVRARRAFANGTFGPSLTVQSTPSHDYRVTTTDLVMSGAIGVEMWVGKLDNAVGQIDIKALTARVQPEFRAYEAISTGPWIGGQGHSGVRFDGAPTYIEYNGVGGGQVGYAATFREVGAWE